MGNAGLAREYREKARHVFKGPVAHYTLEKREIYSRGLMLAIPDEVMKAGKVGTALFRVWFKVDLVEVLLEKPIPRKRAFNGREKGEHTANKGCSAFCN